MVAGADGGGAARDVVYKLVVENDPRNAAILARFGQDLAQLDRSRMATARDLATSRVAQEQQTARQIVADTSRLHETLRNIERQTWQQTTLLRSQAMESLERQAAREADAAARTSSAWKRTTADGLEGIRLLTQGVVEFGLVGEENIRKVLDTILLLRGATDIFKGGIKLGGAIGEATGLGGVIAGGIAALGVSAATAAAAVTALGVAAAVAANRQTLLDRGHLDPQTWGGNALIGIGAVLDRPLGLIPGFSGSRELANAALAAQRESARMQAARDVRLGGEARRAAFAAVDAQERSSRLAGDFEQNRADAMLRGLSGADLDRAANAANVRTAEQEVSRAQADLSRARREGLAEEMRAVETLKQSQQALRTLQEEALRLEQEKQRVAVQAAREQLASAEQLYQTARQISREAWRSFESDLERFGDLGPDEQSRLRRIRETLDRGGAIGRGDERFAEQFNEFDPIVRGQRIARARAAGGEFVFSGGQAAAVAAKQKEIEARGARDVAKEAVDQLEAAGREYTDAMVRALGQLIREQNDNNRRYADHAILQMRAELASQDFERRAASR